MTSKFCFGGTGVSPVRTGETPVPPKQNLEVIRGPLLNWELTATNPRAGKKSDKIPFRDLHSEKRDLSFHCAATISTVGAARIETVLLIVLEKGKPAARWGRKAMGS